MTSRHVLVTGGAGFIGTHLCATLLDRGDRVTAVDNLSAGLLPALASLEARPGFALVRRSVTAPIPVTVPVDAVVHMASPIGPGMILAQPISALRANALGTHSALELARQHTARFVLVSTSDIYGDPLVHPQREDYRGNVDPTGPYSAYVEGKRFAEAATFAYKRQYGMNVGVVRPANIYGPGMYATHPSVVVSFITAALAGQTLTLHGGGTQTRAMCFIDDFVAGLVAMLDSDEAGPVNIGSDEEVTIRHLAELVIETAGSGTVHITEGRDQDAARRCPDIGLAYDLFGWKPQVSLRDGIERTVAWARTLRKG